MLASLSSLLHRTVPASSVRLLIVVLGLFGALKAFVIRIRTLSLMISRRDDHDLIESLRAHLHTALSVSQLPPGSSLEHGIYCTSGEIEQIRLASPCHRNLMVVTTQMPLLVRHHTQEPRCSMSLLLHRSTTTST